MHAGFTGHNASYVSIGAVADLYNGATEVGRHFFNKEGEPTFVIVNAQTGAEEGRLLAKPTARAGRERQVNDGGYGSVDAELLLVHAGTGV